MQKRNRNKGRLDTLEKDPLANGEIPTCEYPKCITVLLVAGNEDILDTNIKANWNREKRLALIQEYKGFMCLMTVRKK